MQEKIKEEYLKTCSDLNFAKKHPEVLCEVANNAKFILNPAREDVKEFIVESIAEVAKNYDVALPDGTVVQLMEGSRITNIQIIAGSGRDCASRSQSRCWR